MLSNPCASVGVDSHRKPALNEAIALSEVRKELIEKLGRNDPCPCGSMRSFRSCCLHSGRFEGVNRHYYF
ncbi:MAG: SEC-C metal-binding domain-containing protein [Planctomycetota bacterium]